MLEAEEIVNVPSIILVMVSSTCLFTLQVPDYYEIVKNPIDLETMRMQYQNGEYGNPADFVNDFALMIDNAELYNKVSSICRFVSSTQIGGLIFTCHP